MPYTIRKIRNSNPPLYSVKNIKTGIVHSYGTTYDKAHAQVRLLHSRGKN